MRRAPGTVAFEVAWGSPHFPWDPRLAVVTPFVCGSEPKCSAPYHPGADARTRRLRQNFPAVYPRPSARQPPRLLQLRTKNVASKLQSHDSACPDIRVTRRVKHVKACFFQRVYLILSYILSYQGFVSSSSRSPHPVFSSRNLSIYLSIPAIRSLRHLVPSRLPCRVTSTSSTVMRTTVPLRSLPIASGHWPTLVWH